MHVGDVIISVLICMDRIFSLDEAWHIVRGLQINILGNIACSIYGFGRAPAPASLAASAGALSNTLKMERLYTIVCKKVEQQFWLPEGGAKKTSSTSPAPLFCKEPEPSKHTHNRTRSMLPNLQYMWQVNGRSPIEK